MSCRAVAAATWESSRQDLLPRRIEKERIQQALRLSRRRWVRPKSREVDRIAVFLHRRNKVHLQVEL
jgi:hypothetical protein